MRRLLKVMLVTVVMVVGAQGTALAASWDYTALGDSLGTGFGAFRGYVPRYETHIEADTGNTVNHNNLSRNGWTSEDLLSALRNDAGFRRAVRRAEVVTYDIGGNDLRDARERYKQGTCGGADNQDCLRTTVNEFESNWDAITAEILSLRSPRNTVIRTMDIYNPYVGRDVTADSWANDGGQNDFQAFKPYAEEANSHIAATSTTNGIRYAPVYRAFNGPSGAEDPSGKGYIFIDGLHPNDRGHAVIAGLFRDLGYAPLR